MTLTYWFALGHLLPDCHRYFLESTVAPQQASEWHRDESISSWMVHRPIQSTKPLGCLLAVVNQECNYLARAQPGNVIALEYDLHIYIWCYGNRVWHHLWCSFQYFCQTF